MTRKKNKFFLYKNIGETPLHVLDNLRKKDIFFKDKKLTYAGRLDPMAEGLLLVLSGEECKRKEYYVNLDKEYEFEILIGFKTDSKDVLGISKYDSKKLENISSDEIKEKLKNFTGKQKMKYPIFSSKTVKGKPLFQYALENKINEIC